MTRPAPAPQTFEAAMAELETIVRQMETGDLPLEQALEHYQRGAVLLRQCQDRLDAAEQQVRMLEGDSLVRLETEGSGPDGAARG